MFTYLISTSPWLLQELLLFPSRRKWTPGLSPLWEELSDQYAIRAFSTHCSLHKFPDSEPRSQVGRDCHHGTSDRPGHLLCEKRARSDSDSLFSTAVEPGHSLEMGGKIQGCTQTCHTMDLTSRTRAETSKMDLSQPLELDI